MTHLTDAEAVIIAALITAFVAAGVAVFTTWWQRRPKSPVRRATDAAWQKRLDLVDERLRAQYERQLVDKDRQITRLEAELENLQRDARRGGRNHD